ncbi:MAG TPA: hypothetical protein VGV12_16555 [Gemmatimonadales bacterium]|nr:hypothetical protein [Gemmatimonadales bacterium]
MAALRWPLLICLLVPAAAVAQQVAATRIASVTFLGGGWLFIDAGTMEGLRQGSEADVVRRGRTVAVLRVESLGDHQASCTLVSSQLHPIVGDSVRFTIVAPLTRTPPVIAARPPSPAPAPRVASSLRDSTPRTPNATPVSTQPGVQTTAIQTPVARAPVAQAPVAQAPVAQAPVPQAPATPTPTVKTPTVQMGSRTDSTARLRTRLPIRDTTASRPGTTTVTFLSGAEVYVGAGRKEGLIEGSELAVVRRDSTVSTLRVKFLASHQSACEVIRGATDIVVGDAVRFTPRLPPGGTGTTTAEARPRGPHRLSGPGIHGRVGLRYLSATSTATGDSVTAAGSTGFNQPSFDLRMSGLSIGGTAMGLSVDLRTRRTVTSSTGQPDAVDGRTRVYQAAIFWGAPGAGFRTVAGRQYLTAVTSVSLFDGGLIEFNGPRMTFGAFGGLEPDAATLGLSNDIQDYGGYVQFHNRPGTLTAWTLTTGAVGSLEASHANREFGFLQANVSNSHFSFYGLQEVDYYPWWKVQLGEKQFSFTSQYFNALIRPSPWLSFNGSYDNRRSVRLYRDTQNPETAFDDAYRQGYGGGFQLSRQKTYFGADWRRSTGGTAGAADSYTGTFGLDRVTPLNLGLSIRATLYQNQNDSTLNNPDAKRTIGQLYSGRLGFDPVSLVHIELDGGIRHEDNPTTAMLQKSQWIGVDVDASVARAWFVSFSGLRQQDPANPGTITTTQLYVSITWRF